MKPFVLLAWLCVVGLLAVVVALHLLNNKAESELAHLRQENQSLQSQRAADKAGATQAKASSSHSALGRCDFGIPK
jgi:hypothetical protein